MSGGRVSTCLYIVMETRDANLAEVTADARSTKLKRESCEYGRAGLSFLHEPRVCAWEREAVQHPGGRTKRLRSRPTACANRDAALPPRTLWASAPTWCESEAQRVRSPAAQMPQPFAEIAAHCLKTRTRRTSWQSAADRRVFG